MLTGNPVPRQSRYALHARSESVAFDQQFIDTMVRAAQARRNCAQRAAARRTSRDGGIWPTTYCAAGRRDQSMRKWPQSWYRSAHDTRQRAGSRWGGMAGMSRADQTMDTPADVERPPPRSEPFDVVYIPPCGGGQRLPPGVWVGTVAMCDTRVDTTGVGTRSTVPHLKRPVPLPAWTSSSHDHQVDDRSS